MPAIPKTTGSFLDLCLKSGCIDSEVLKRFLAKEPLPEEPARAAGVLVKNGLLTRFQASQLMAGRHRGFVIGQLRVLDKLGKGGMATVFLCEQLALRRRVAVKILPQHHAKDIGVRERFYREARAAAVLDHPNIVRVHDINCTGDLHYLVMEYVEGVDLQAVLQKSGPLGFMQAVGYASQAAAGLQHAHEKGLVHRDIKPANLFVDKQGVVKILDMGLARFFADPKDDLTRQYDNGAVLGTVDFLSPEQAIASSSVDHRADIYSLGATLYMLIVGRPPFEGSTAQKLLSVQLKEPTAVALLRRDVPPELSDVVARMMAKEPAERFQSAAEVIEALSPWCPALPEALAGSTIISRRTKPDLSPTTISAAVVAAAVPPPLPLSARSGPSSQIQPAPSRSEPASSHIRPGSSLIRPASSRVKLPQTAPPSTARRKKLIIAGAGGGTLLLAVVIALIVRSSGQSDDAGTKQSALQQDAGSVQSDRPMPRAAVPAPANAIYHLDFANASAAHVTVQGPNRNAEVGAFPDGWSVQAWDPSAQVDGAVEEVDGAVALTFRTLKGQASVIVFSPNVRLEAGHAYELAIEYRSIGVARGDVKCAYPSASQRLGELAPGGAGWRRVTFPVSAPRSEDVHFEFHNSASGQGHRLCIGMVSLRETTPPPPPAVVRNGPSRDYRIDFSKLKPFNIQMTNTRFDRKDGDWPEGWTGDCWRPGGRGEFNLEQLNGTWAWATRNLADTSLQLWSEKVFEGTRPGGRYVLKLVYAAEENAFGEVDLRKRDKRLERMDGMPLTPTNGEWRTVEMVVCPTQQLAYTLCIQNRKEGPRSTIYLRSVEVTEWRPGDIATTLKNIDFREAKPFAAWVRQDQEVHRTGQGAWPDGWGGSTSNPETVAEFEVKKIGDSQALCMRNNDGPPGARFGSLQPAASMRMGKRYAVLFAYKAEDKIKAFAGFHDNNRSQPFARLTLPASGNEWRQTGIILTADRDRPLYLFFQNESGGDKTNLFIRSVEVLELPGT
jgi:eukaryotic-like serine/threonine-protein kinase